VVVFVVDRVVVRKCLLSANLEYVVEEKNGKRAAASFAAPSIREKLMSESGMRAPGRHFAERFLFLGREFISCRPNSYSTCIYQQEDVKP
jgi:hypothetical protein